jgi:hypothetical protein
MNWVTTSLDLVRRHWQRVGPYLLVELLLPGGSLLALCLFLYRNRGSYALAPGFVRLATAGARVIATATVTRPRLCAEIGR